MNNKYFKYFTIFIIFALGAVSLTWTNTHSMLNTGDFIFPSYGIKELHAFFNSWNTASLGSIDYFRLSFLLPYGLYLAVMYLVGASSIQSQMFWNYLLFISLGLSMYFLVTQLIQDRSKYAAGLIAAIFFMLNPWVGQNIAMFFPYITFIPLLLGLYIKGLNANKDFKYLIVFSLTWCFVLSLSLWNIRGFIFQWLSLTFYLLFFSIYHRKKIRQAFVFTFILIMLHVLLNAHWLLLFFTNILKSASGSIKVYEAVSYSRLSSFETASSTTIQTLRMLADWSMTANIKGVLHFPWLSYYQHPLLIFIGFLLPISVLISLLFVIQKRASENKHFVFFFLLLLFGYFISMGRFNPAGTWLADKFQFYLLIFSAPAVHGGIFIVISYSVLLAYSFIFTCRLIKNNRLRSLIGILYIVVIIIYGYPIWSGQFIPTSNNILGAGRYEIPKYALDLKKQTDNEGSDYRIFPLPYSKLGYFAYNWAPRGYNGPDPLINILTKSQVVGTGLGMQIADTTAKNIDKTSFFKLASLLNVKYIMYKRDANLLHIKNNAWYTVPDQLFLNTLYQDNNKVSSFGHIDLIKIPDELFLPKLYTPLKIINAGNVNELANIVSQKDYVTRSAIYVGNLPNIPNTPNIPKTSEKTILEYRMISPMKYRVRVHNAAGTFPLAMSESFHEGWKIYLTEPDNFKFPAFAKASAGEANIQGTVQNDNLPAGPIYETWFKKPIKNNKNHLMVNGYANSWIIDTNKLCNNEVKCIKNSDGSYDFELMIAFWPQRIYYFGLVISITTLIACITYLFISSSRRRPGSSL